MVLVFGCLGGYALTYLPLERPSQSPGALESTDRATAVISPTPLPPRTATAIAPAATSALPTPTSPAIATPPRVTGASLIDKIDYADGYDWRSASDADRTELCMWLAVNEQRAMGDSPGWVYYSAGLTAFYDTNEPFVLEQRILEIAAVLGLVSRQ